jgi:hypothetical protein
MRNAHLKKGINMEKQVTDDASKNGESRLRDDLIWGVEGISEEIGKSQRQVFHMISIGAIPAAKVGGRIVASRSRLRQHFAALLDGSRS